MKNIYLVPCSLLALTALPTHTQAGVDLGSAAGFAVLGNTDVTSTGDTVLNGNLGVYPGNSITGFAPGIVNGTTYNGGSIAQQAVSDALSAYVALKAETPGQNLTGENLGGMTLAPGVYQYTSSAQLTGQLVFNAGGNPNAQFVIQVGTTLTSADLASVVLEGGAQANNIFWQVGSSATIGDGSVMFGSILADDSVTMDTGASLDGNAVALTGGVTLDDNDISVSAIPETNSLWALAVGAAIVGTSSSIAARRRKTRGINEGGGKDISPDKNIE